MPKKINLQKVKSVLIIAGPSIEDTFLFTPLAKAIKNYNPEIEIDFLVKKGSAQYISECKQIRKVIEFEYKTTFSTYFKMIKTIFRKYDLSFTSSGTDRFILISYFAGKKRVSVLPKLCANNFWKRFLSTAYINQNLHVPTSEIAVQLSEKLGLPKTCEFIFPKAENLNFIEATNNYAVIHATTKDWWKEWPKEYWIETISYLQKIGLNVYLTGGTDKDEIKYNKSIEEHFCKNSKTKQTVKSLAGKTNFGALCETLKYAQLYLGIDTITSHIAAALGVNTVVVFGPVDHVKWAPRPYNYTLDNFWFNSNYGVQTIENVSICKANCKCQNFKIGCGLQYQKITRCLQALGEELIFQAINTQLELSDGTDNEMETIRINKVWTK